jgi:hypothetical protein
MKNIVLAHFGLCFSGLRINNKVTPFVLITLTGFSKSCDLYIYVAFPGTFGVKLVRTWTEQAIFLHGRLAKIFISMEVMYSNVCKYTHKNAFKGTV